MERTSRGFKWNADLLLLGYRSRILKASGGLGFKWTADLLLPGYCLRTLSGSGN